MSKIVIEWDRQHVIVADVEAGGNKTAFRSVNVIERREDGAGTEEFVAALKRLVPSSGKSPVPVTLVLPRQQVTVHRIQLPQVPDNEIPDMIRLQAAMRLTVPVETVCLDFAPLPVVAGSPTRDVLLVTTPLDNVNSIRRILASCQLELVEVRVSSFCIATLLANAGVLTPQSDPTIVDAVVLMRKDFIEVTFARGTHVVFSHSGASWTADDGIERAVRSELNRARMAASESLGEYRVGRLLLIGRASVIGAVSDQIAGRMDNAAMDRIDPAGAFFSGTLPADISADVLVAIAGAATVPRAGLVEAVDLINPRKPPVKRDLRRVKILAGVLAAVLVCGVAWNWRQGQLNELQETLDQLNTEVTDLRQTLDRGKADSDLAVLVGQWVERDINWLDEMDRLQQLLPGTDRMIVRNFQFGSKQVGGLGTIRLDGTAKTRDDVENLARKLTDAGYLVTPYNPEDARISGTYPVAITLQLTIPQKVASGPPQRPGSAKKA